MADTTIDKRTGYREKGDYAHDTQHGGLAECDLVGKCDPLNREYVRTIRTPLGRNLVRTGTWLEGSGLAGKLESGRRVITYHT